MQTSSLPAYPGASAPLNPYAQNNMYQAPQTGSFPQGYPGYPSASPGYPQASPSYPTAGAYGVSPSMQHVSSCEVRTCSTLGLQPAHRSGSGLWLNALSCA